MVLWKLLVGLFLIIGVVTSFIVSIARTPDNLRGFYGAMYAIIGGVGLIGGIILTATAFV